MATPKESIGFGVEIDAKQAIRELNKLRKQAGQSMVQLSDPSGGVMKPAQENIEKLATATTGLTSAFGGAAGSIGAALGATSNLASAWMVSGPVGAAVAGLAFLAGKLWSEIEEADKKAAAAAETFDNHFKVSLENIESAAEDAADAIQKVGKKASEVSLQALKDQREFNRLQLEATANIERDEEAKLQRLEATRSQRVEDMRSIQDSRLRAGAIGGLTAEEQKQHELARERLSTASKERAELAKQDEALRRAIALRERQVEVEDKHEKAVERRRKKRAKDKKDAKEFAKSDDPEAVRMMFLAKMRKDMAAFGAAEEKAINDQLQRDLRIADDKRLADEKAAHDAHVEHIRANYQMLIGEGLSAFNQSTAIMTNMLTGIIDGEALAIEKAGLALVAMVGSELVAKGTAGLFKGAMMNAEVPGSGVPLMAVSAAAVGAGTGMAAGSAVGSAALQRAHASGKYRSITSATGVNVGLARLFGDQDGTPDIQGPAALDVSEQDDFGAGRVVDRERVQLIFNSAFYEGRQGALDMMQDAEDANKYQLRTR